MNDTQTLDAPVYFNHIRFGPYYRELVVEEGNRVNLHPLLLLSVIRQESFFEGFVASGADARGLMQVLPATGQEMVDRYNWPPNYATEDLLNPAVNLRLGARYLANQRDYFEDSYVAWQPITADRAMPTSGMNWRATIRTCFWRLCVSTKRVHI